MEALLLKEYNTEYKAGNYGKYKDDLTGPIGSFLNGFHGV